MPQSVYSYAKLCKQSVFSYTKLGRVPSSSSIGTPKEPPRRARAKRWRPRCLWHTAKGIGILAVRVCMYVCMYVCIYGGINNIIQFSDLYVHVNVYLYKYVKQKQVR